MNKQEQDLVMSGDTLYGPLLMFIKDNSNTGIQFPGQLGAHQIIKSIVFACRPLNVLMYALYIKVTYHCLSLSFHFFYRIKHANIVSLEDIYENKSHLYLVMQL